MKHINNPDGTAVIQATVKEFAEIIGEDYLVATGITKWLVNNEAVKVVGKVPAEGGRGKPNTLFEYPQKIDLDFWPDTENGTEVADVEQGAQQAALD